MTPFLSLLFLECFRIDEVIDVGVKVVVRGGGGGARTGVGAKEHGGASSSTFATLLVLVTVDFFVCPHLETLTAPPKRLFDVWPHTLVGPVRYTATVPAVSLLPTAVEGQVFVRSTSIADLAPLVLLQLLGV